MVITVPDTFSTNLVSGQGDDPQRAQIMLQRNDANGFVIGSITNSAQSSIARAIDETAVRSYFDAVFANLKVIREGMQQAADGAGQLHDGALSAHDGAGQLASGLDTASTGAGTLASGLGELNSGAAKLSDGAQQVAAGTQQLADTLDPVLSLAADRLPGIQQQVGSAAAQVDSLRLRSPVRPAPSPAASPTPRPAWTRSSRPTRNLRPILPWSSCVNA